MSTFTPGPWEVRRTLYSKGFTREVVTRDGKLIARVTTQSVDGAVAEANAQLIAVAPALLTIVNAFYVNRHNITADEPFQGALHRLMGMADVALTRATESTDA